MSRRHPTDTLLQRWLAGDPDVDVDVDRHVTACDRCAEALETMDDADDDLSDALAMALAPPGDLSERLVAGVEAQLSSRAVFGIVADMFGAGLDTSRMLMFEDTNDDN